MGHGMLALKLVWMFLSVQNYTGCGALALSNYSALVVEPLAQRYLIIPLKNTNNYISWSGSGLSCVNYSGDRFFVSVGDQVRIHNVINGELIASFSLNSNYSGVVAGLNATSFVSCGDLCGKFVIIDGEPVEFWNTNVGKASDISIYGDYVFIADSSWWKVVVLNLTDGSYVSNITFDAPVTSVSACGSLLAAYSSGYVYVYNITNVSDPEVVKKLGPFGYVSKVRFSPKCTYLLIDGDDSIYLYYSSNLSLALKECWCPNALKDVDWLSDDIFGVSYVPIYSPEWCNVEMYKLVHVTSTPNTTTTTSVQETPNFSEGVPAPFVLPLLAALRRLRGKRSPN